MALPSVWFKATLMLGTRQKAGFYNVFYYKPAAAPTWTSDPTADTQNIGDSAASELIDGLTAVLTTETEIVGVAYELHKDGQVYETSTINGTFGVIPGDEEPDYAAVVIQKRTATPGRSGRGRWFLGPVPEANTDENRIDVAARAAYEGVADQWTLAIDALGTSWKPQLYSKKNEDLYEITSNYVDWKLGIISGRKSHSLLT